MATAQTGTKAQDSPGSLKPERKPKSDKEPGGGGGVGGDSSKGFKFLPDCSRQEIGCQDKGSQHPGESMKPCRAHANRHTFPNWDVFPKSVYRTTEINAQWLGNGSANHSTVRWMNFHTAV